MCSLCPLQQGQIEFEVVYVAPELDSDDENVEYEDDNGHHYRLYLDELDPSSSTAASNSSASLQGKLQTGTYKSWKMETASSEQWKQLFEWRFRVKCQIWACG